MRTMVETLMGMAAILLIVWHAATHAWLAQLLLGGWLVTWLAWAWDTYQRRAKTVTQSKVVELDREQYEVSLQVRKLPVAWKLREGA